MHCNRWIVEHGMGGRQRRLRGLTTTARSALVSVVVAGMLTSCGGSNTTSASDPTTGATTSASPASSPASSASSPSVTASTTTTSTTTVTAAPTTIAPTDANGLANAYCAQVHKKLKALGLPGDDLDGFVEPYFGKEIDRSMRCSLGKYAAMQIHHIVSPEVALDRRAWMTQGVPRSTVPTSDDVAVYFRQGEPGGQSISLVFAGQWEYGLNWQIGVDVAPDVIQKASAMIPSAADPSVVPTVVVPTLTTAPKP
jgi:hypothetical protein